MIPTPLFPLKTDDDEEEYSAEARIWGTVADIQDDWGSGGIVRGVEGAEEIENLLPLGTGEDGEDNENTDDVRLVLVEGVVERRRISGKNRNSLSLVMLFRAIGGGLGSLQTGILDPTTDCFVGGIILDFMGEKG